jgi:putative NADH-flavin reductase
VAFVQATEPFMKLIVFGATGGIGRLLVSGALELGHAVTAFVRPGRAMEPRDGLRILEGDIFDPQSVSDAIEGQRAVLCALGARTLKKENILSRAIPLIMNGMHFHMVDRIITVGAAGALYPAGKYQPRIFTLVLTVARLTILRHPMADQRAQERLLAASDLDYTIVRPPRLTDDPPTKTYRVLPDALPSSSTRISRADVADFMLQQLTDPRFHRRGVYLAE